MDLKSLAKKHGLSDLEKYQSDSSDYVISFVANNLKQSEVTHTKGIAYRVINNKRVGFASSYGQVNDDETVTKAKELSVFSPEVDIKLPSNVNITENRANINENEHFFDFKDKGKELINSIKDRAKSDSLLIDISYNKTFLSESIENTNDVFYNSTKNIYSFSINLRETHENDFIEIFNAVTDIKDVNYTKCVEETLDLYIHSKRHAKVTNGSMPVLFSARAIKDLLNIIESALSGKQVNQKSSPWFDKLEKQVTSKCIKVMQDPLYGFMARSIDDEGNPVQNLTLIDSGILKSFYFDIVTASKSTLNVSSTGNGFKSSISSLPEPELLNMVIKPGNKSLDTIIKNIDYGLLVDQTIGALSSNISGDVSVNVDLGFLIEKGQIVGRVKDTMINGNIYHALNNVIELSNTQKGYWSNIYNPDMLLEGFTVTTN